MKDRTHDWKEAVHLLVAFEEGTAHLDQLLERFEVHRSLWLVLEVFRNWLLVDRILEARVSRRPRPLACHLLRLAMTECLVRESETHPRIVHHAVATAAILRLTPPEKSFINGVLRAFLREPFPLPREDAAATHPAWLVGKWRKAFGEEGLNALLKWNQTPAVNYVLADQCPEYAVPTAWDGYFRLPPGAFRKALPDLEAGKVYIQDPFARKPVDLLAPSPGERVLDLCAAPGGKSRLISRRMSSGYLAMVDKPGARFKRLLENLATFAGPDLLALPSAVEQLEGAFRPHGIETGSFDAVLIDVPCSNTGVIRRRPDVRLRLLENDLQRLAAGQLTLLTQAARWVRPGGRLVYSTCSIEEEENRGVVQAFLSRDRRWVLREELLSLPWEEDHDGGGAFLLTMS